MPIARDVLQMLLPRAWQLYQDKNWAEAEVVARQIYQSEPEQIQLGQLWALCLAEQGKGEQALEVQQQVCQSDHSEQAWSNWGLMSRRFGHKDRAIEIYQQFLAREDHPHMRFRLANVLYELERNEEAIAQYQLLLGVWPRHMALRLNLAYALSRLDRREEALGHLEVALLCEGDTLAVKRALANNHQSLGQLDNALALYEELLQEEPTNHNVRSNYALALLGAGYYRRGFKAFDARWHTEGRDTLRQMNKPLWRGEPLDGRRLLAWPEQGLGDQIMFARYASELAGRGHEVVVSCYDWLVDLFKTLPNVAAVYPYGQVPEQAYDLQVPMIDMARWLKLSPESMGKRVPYVSADPAKLALWSERLGPKTHLRVGLVWASGKVTPTPDYVRSVEAKSLPLPLLAPLSGLAGVRFYSLQRYDNDERRRAFPPEGFEGLEDFSDLMVDFSHTAAVMQLMDLIVTVDSAPAHLAGALNRPTFVMVRRDGHWPWALSYPESSPWYPSVRLFRQGPDGWGPVAAAVCHAVRQFVGQR